jgi:WD40 repeat protein/tRNA A-37 threonylcarbamoyl transferase component Bud32
MLLVAVGEGRTLSGTEELQLHDHVAGCETCRALTVETTGDRLRWVARIPEDALDDPDLLVLPTIDPIVFAKGDELAHGGMGRITRARDRRLGRDVAIKEVLAPYLRARFEREAMITARLQHPAIVPVYEAGAWPDGSAFYTMRLVSGGTLGDAIARTQTLEDRLALLPHVLALTEALAYAHSRRVVHRDLKPANVLVGEFGETVVIDWGLAKELDRSGPEAGAGADAAGSVELTRAGSVVGTPCFIAPEQAAGAEIDERADVYALGAILYNLLAGHPPHWDSIEHSADRLIDAARQSPPTPIEKLAPRAPADLRAIVERAMARDKAARYPTAKEMAEELRRFEAGQLLGSREYRTSELIVRWIRRHRAAVAVAAIAASVLAIGGVISVRQIVTHQRETERALAESQLERGRQLLVDGDPGQAAAYLAAALAELPDDAVARRLAAIAVRDAPRRLGSFAGTAAAFRRDGGELAIGSADGSIAVIDPATALPLRTLLRLGGAVMALAYAPDGSRLAVASTSGAYLRDVATGALTAIASKLPSSELRFVSHGDRIAIASADAVSLVGLDGTLLATYGPIPGPHALAESFDGAALVALTRDGAIAWRAADLTRIADVRAESAARFAVAFDHGDLILAGVDGVRRASPWSGHVTTVVSEPSVTLSWIDDRTLLSDGKIIHTDVDSVRPFARTAVQAAASIDRTHVITGGYDRTLRVWDLERVARPIVVLDAATATDTLIVDQNHRRAVSCGAPKDGTGARIDARIELWDIAHTYTPARRAVGMTPIDALLADHHGRLAVHLDTEHTTKLVTTSLEVLATLDGWPVGFRPHHGEIVTDDEGVLSIYASRDGKRLRQVGGGPPDSDKIWQVAFSSTGLVVATSSDRHVTLRDADWGVTTSFELPTDVSAISALAVDDDGRVVTGHEDGTLRIWDPRARDARLHEPRTWATGHTTHIAAIELRSDTLVTASWDGTMRRWAFPSGEPRGIFKRFSDASISPDGQRIATVDGSAAVSLWDSVHDRLLEQIPTLDGLVGVVFIDDDHVVAGGDRGRLELIDLSVRARTVDDVMRFVAASTRWQLVGERVVERR